MTKANRFLLQLLLKVRGKQYPNKERQKRLQSNLFITDTKGTGISVRIVEVSVLEK